jgi:hypothetical protein
VIEVLRAKSGHAVAKWAGRLVCSSVQPLLEADAWAKKNAPRVRGLQQVLVLGVGCGYHLAALQRECPSVAILAVDTQKELIDLAKRENGLDVTDIQFLAVADQHAFVKSAKVQRFVKSEYSVLKFAPAISTSPAIYKEIEDLALGRVGQGFHFILSQRPELFEVLDAERAMAQPRELISIKNVEAAIRGGTDAMAGLLIRALRELVN